MIVLWFAVCAVIGYLLGGFNGAILVSKWFRGEDIRTKGSGNAGLTNFYRNYGGLDTLLVLLIDVGKAVLACFLGQWILGTFDPAWATGGAMFCGVFTVLGHVFPIWFGFKGGKGILTSGAVGAFMSWKIIAALLVIFIIVLLLSRYVSLGSIVCCGAYPFLFWWFAPKDGHPLFVLLLSCFLAALALWMHRTNIKRLAAGKENKFSLHKK